MYNAGLVVLPSLLEVCLEVRNFFLRQSALRQHSLQVGQAAGSGGNGGGAQGVEMHDIA